MDEARGEVLLVFESSESNLAISRVSHPLPFLLEHDCSAAKASRRSVGLHVLRSRSTCT